MNQSITNRIEYCRYYKRKFERNNSKKLKTTGFLFLPSSSFSGAIDLDITYYPSDGSF
jgi:hypothetical protein